MAGDLVFNRRRVSIEPEPASTIDGVNMTERAEIVKFEEFLRRNAGCTFVFHPAGLSFPERFSVSVPVDRVYGGLIWGEGETLDAAYANACVRREDRMVA